jgi:hypothetical protein
LRIRVKSVYGTNALLYGSRVQFGHTYSMMWHFTNNNVPNLSYKFNDQNLCLSNNLTMRLVSHEETAQTTNYWCLCCNLQELLIYMFSVAQIIIRVMCYTHVWISD